MEDKQVTTSIGWSGILLIVLVGLITGLLGPLWAVPLAMTAVGIAYGVWKCVRILGMIFNHLHWRDIELPAADDE